MNSNRTGDPELAGLVVVGAGPGGYAAAFLAADLGMDVTLIDPEADPGGVCLFRGCIPSKAMLHVARVLEEAGAAESFGVKFGEPEIDLERMRSWKDGVVGRLTSGLGQLAIQRKVRYVRGTARLLGSNRLHVEAADGAIPALQFEHAILATGSRPVTVPGFPHGSDRVMDSTAALSLDGVPSRLLVVGGGYIGLELGSVYAALGSRVSVVEMLDGLLPGVDRDLVRPLRRRLDTRFESIRLGARVSAVEEADDSLRVTIKGQAGETTTESFDRALVAVGRRPNSEGLGLEAVGIETDSRGFVRVDAARRTVEPAIYAIGDLAGDPMLAHKAAHEARTAVEAIAGRKAAFDPAAIPAVVFTDPEIAWCGLTEAEARDRGRDVKIARFPWAASGRARTLGRDDGLTKLVIDPGTERILGVGICGPGAGELIAEGVLAVEMAALASDLRACIHPHPTLSETLMEAADLFFGQSAHFRAPARK